MEKQSTGFKPNVFFIVGIGMLIAYAFFRIRWFSWIGIILLVGGAFLGRGQEVKEDKDESNNN